jgi:hypothetical protein
LADERAATEGGIGASDAQTPIPAQPSSENLAATTPGVGGPGAATEPEKLDGKSSTELRTMYSEAERRLSAASKENSQLRTFVQRIAGYFQTDPETNEISFNDDMIKRYVEYKGLLKNDQNQPANQTTPNNVPPQTQDAAFDALDQDQKTEIERIIAERLQAALKERVDPVRDEFKAHQYNLWIEQLKGKYNDFEGFRPKMVEYMQKFGLQDKVKNIEDLETIYRATKANNDGYVDKAVHEGHVGELQKALSVFNPGISSRPVDNANASEEELLGLDEKREDSKITEALFGKSYLDNR